MGAKAFDSRPRGCQSRWPPSVLCARCGGRWARKDGGGGGRFCAGGGGWATIQLLVEVMVGIATGTSEMGSEAVGFKETSKNTKVNETIMNESSLPAWGRTWARFDFCSGEMFGHSQRSLQARGGPQDMLQDADREYWFSTQGLLMTLLHWSRFRKTVRDKQRSRAVLDQFLRLCVDGDKLLALRLGESPPEHRHLCRERPINHDMCSCMSLVQRRVDQQRSSPQSGVAELMAGCFLQAECAASRWRLRHIVVAIAEVIDQDV